MKMASGKWRPFCLGHSVLKSQAISLQHSLILPTAISFLYVTRSKKSGIQSCQKNAEFGENN